MIYLLLYFAIPTFILCTALYLNRQKKWLTRSAVNEKTDGAVIGLGMFALALWPVALLMLTFVAIFFFIKNHVLPEN